MPLQQGAMGSRQQLQPLKLVQLTQQMLGRRLAQGDPWLRRSSSPQQTGPCCRPQLHGQRYQSRYSGMYWASQWQLYRHTRLQSQRTPLLSLLQSLPLQLLRLKHLPPLRL